MKNYTTPRTLAQCNFDTGYPSVTVKRRRTVDVLFTVVLAVVAAVSIFFY